MIHHRGQITTPGTTCPTLSELCVGSFTLHRVIVRQGCGRFTISNGRTNEQFKLQHLIEKRSIEYSVGNKIISIDLTNVDVMIARYLSGNRALLSVCYDK